MPERPWRLRQRWTRLLFAHWPMPPAEIQKALPRGLTVDVHDGQAWLGVVPFLMDQVRVRTVGESSFAVPGARAFPELNLRTYVRAGDGRAGVYFFSLDAGSLLAVLGARVGFALPYFWTRMRVEVDGDTVSYSSQRRAGPAASFEARYRPTGRASAQDELRQFLTERYALFTQRFGRVQAGEIHHASWRLQEAEAEFVRNDLPRSFGFTLPNLAPVLHYAAEVHMEAWTIRKVE